MGDPRASQNAARLSEDIGDVLNAIRRMIADDDALSSSRDSIRSGRPGLVQDDAGEFLARRHGGNAALARHIVETVTRPAPAPTAAEEEPKAPVAAVPSLILRPRSEAVPPADPVRSPLRAERRVDEPEPVKVSGWRAWLRPELREAAPQVEAAAPMMDSLTERVETVAEDEDDFAEAFDWKARMRPDIDEPKPQPMMAEARPAEPRHSGWVLSPDPVVLDPVAQLAAEVAAFDAEHHAPFDPEAEERGIRELLREMVQEELNGELGQRFSANLRAVIRREIAAALDTHLDRL